MKYKTTIIIIFFLLLTSSLWANPVANPSWYDITFTELPTTGPSLFNNSIDIWSANLTNMNFAKISTGLKIVPPAGYENLKIRFLTSGSVFRFIKTNDPTKWVDVAIRLKHENLALQNVLPSTDYPIVAGAFGSPLTVTNLYMDVVALPPNSGQSYRGDYYFPLEIQIIDNDGFVLDIKTLQMTMFFRTPSVPVAPVTTFTLERYPAADAITTPYPYLGTTPMTPVGKVSFQSNEEYNKYRVRISPVGQPLFQFSNTNPNRVGTIPYLVSVPGRTTSYSNTFEVRLDYKGVIGSWYDEFDIGVSNVNYSNSKNTTGLYVSTLLIELISL